MRIAVLKERAAGEQRVAITPETVRKFAALGAEIAVEASAGEYAAIADGDYTEAGAAVGPAAETVPAAVIIIGKARP